MASPFGNWFIWLNKELEKQNKNAIVPQFPTGVGFPTYENWSKLLKYYLELGFIDD